MDNFFYNNTTKVRLMEVDNKSYKLFTKKTLICKNCNQPVEKESNSWISKCKICNTLVLFFHPTPIQRVAAMFEAQVIFNIGAYGSGKTTISAYKLSMMLRKIPNSRLICIANTLQQLNKNAISELKKFIHKSEIKKKTRDTWELVNNSTIEFWPSDNSDKLRSANVNFIWLVEANDYKMLSIYQESQARIRNESGFVYEYDEHNNIKTYIDKQGIEKPIIKKVMNFILVEANPEKGAWTNKVVLEANTILYTPKVKGIDLIRKQARVQRHVDPYSGTEKNSDVIAILNATIDNPTLPESYLLGLRNGRRNEQDFNRLAYCDITSQDGLVFEQVVKAPEDYFENIQYFDWYDNDVKTFEGLDPGGANASNDPDAYLFGAVNIKLKRITILDGFKISGLSLAEVAQKILLIRQKWSYRVDRHFLFTADNSLDRSSKVNRYHSLKNDYQNILRTSIEVCDAKGISSGISKVNTWLNNHAIVINSGIPGFKEELFSYEKFEQPHILKATNEIIYKEAYSETNNHYIDVLRYIIVMLESKGVSQNSDFIAFEDHLAKQEQSRFRSKQQSIQESLPILSKLGFVKSTKKDKKNFFN